MMGPSFSHFSMSLVFSRRQVLPVNTLVTRVSFSERR